MLSVIWDPKDIANKHGKENDLLIAFMLAPYAYEYIRLNKNDYYNAVDFESDMSGDLIRDEDRVSNVLFNIGQKLSPEDVRALEEKRTYDLLHKTEHLREKKFAFN